LSLRLTSSLLPIHAALVAIVGLSACSSSKSSDSSLSGSNDDMSMSDLQGSSTNYRPGNGTAYRKSVRPVVHSMPIKDGSHWLNAFYFVTSDSETWQSLAVKFYNRAEHAQLLRDWNKGERLHAGSVIYYNSPFRPQDREKMLSFAEDFGQPADQHLVQAGDSLSKIAGALWGNVHAWPAIAAINPQIAHPDLIEVGETLFIPPSVDSANILAKLLKSSNGSSDLTAQMDDSLPEITGVENDTNSQDKLGSGAVAGTLESQETPSVGPRMPMRTSTMIVLAGIMLVLASLVYVLWKRTQNNDPYSGSLSKMDRLSSFFKTKSGV
jgi:LysM domain